MSGKCETCRWWEREVTKYTPLYGLCRRMPPIIKSPTARICYHPTTRAKDYCGEYQERKDGSDE